MRELILSKNVFIEISVTGVTYYKVACAESGTVQYNDSVATANIQKNDNFTLQVPDLKSFNASLEGVFALDLEANISEPRDLAFNRTLVYLRFQVDDPGRRFFTTRGYFVNYQENKVFGEFYRYNIAFIGTEPTIERNLNNLLELFTDKSQFETPFEMTINESVSNNTTVILEDGTITEIQNAPNISYQFTTTGTKLVTVLPNDSSVINFITCTGQLLQNDLDLSKLTVIQGVLNFSNNDLINFIQPVSSNNLSLNLANNLFAGIIDLSTTDLGINLNLSGNTGLTGVNFGTFGSQTNIISFTLNNCGFTSLDFGAFTNISGLIDASNNPLTLLNIPASPNLIEINASETALADIDLTDVTTLGNNLILDNCTNLFELILPSSSNSFDLIDCENCILTSLDFSVLTNVLGRNNADINLRNNQLNSAALNRILFDLDANSSGGFTGRDVIINGAGNGFLDTFSGGIDGEAAYNSLEAKGINVTPNFRLATMTTSSESPTAFVGLIDFNSSEVAFWDFYDNVIVQQNTNSPFYPFNLSGNKLIELRLLFSENIIELDLASQELVGTLDISQLENMSGLFRCDGNNFLNTVINPATNGTFSEYNASSCGIQSISFATMPNILQLAFCLVDLSFNGMPESVINQVLIDLDMNSTTVGTASTLDIRGNAAPTGTGASAAISLSSKGLNILS